ncbi:MAG: hypothetical protein D8M18_10030 [Bacteroidetes bacterium]|nr:hypothetical protein [Bacteroidota bacterium]
MNFFSGKHVYGYTRLYGKFGCVYFWLGITFGAVVNAVVVRLYVYVVFYHKILVIHYVAFV